MHAPQRGFPRPGLGKTKKWDDDMHEYCQVASLIFTIRGILNIEAWAPHIDAGLPNLLLAQYRVLYIN